MKILFLGGNGNISWYCTEIALQYGYEVWELNRNQSFKTRREIQPQVHRLVCDVRDMGCMEELLLGQHFDVVCDFICYNEAQAKDAVKLFTGKTDQYIFISSESVYSRSTKYLPFRETTPPYAEPQEGTYIYGKIKAEEIFWNAHQQGFPLTVVRPAYTYDTIVPAPIGQNCYTAIKKYEEGFPVLIPGEGSNLWTFTHSRDFAKAFVTLFGNRDTIGEDYHITSDEWLTWNDVAEILKEVCGISSREVVHVPYGEAMKIPFYEDKELLRQRMWHDIYDNTKIKSVAKHWKAETKFADGIYETFCWLNEKEIRKRIVPKLEQELTLLYQKYT